MTASKRVEMFNKTKKATDTLEGELKGTMYPLEGMTKETEKQLIDDHFLFKDDDRIPSYLSLQKLGLDAQLCQLCGTF
jgi:hypothetical protein